MEQVSASPTGNRAVFWVLIIMGIAAFAPCILLPEWRAYEAIHIVEAKEKQKVHIMEAAVDREKRLLEAMQSDPAVIARIAQRDLHFKNPADNTVSIGTPEDGPASDLIGISIDVPEDSPEGPFASRSAATLGGDLEPTQAAQIAPPKFIQPLLARLPEYDYDAIFCDAKTRPLVMGMSVGLIAAAVLIFSSRRVEPVQSEPRP